MWSAEIPFSLITAAQILSNLEKVNKNINSHVIILKTTWGDFTKFVNDGAVMLEFWNVDSYKVHGFPPFEILALLFAIENLSMDSRKNETSRR